MNDVDTLRTCLEEIAAEVTPVDLHARVVAAARRRSLRRMAAGVVTTIAATVAALVLVVSAEHAAAPAPDPSVTGPVAPHPTTLPRYEEEPAPGLGPFEGTATVSVPSWGTADSACATGTVTMTNGQYYRGPGKPPVNVLSSVTTDVDGDGTAEYVAHLSCGEGPEGPAHQIVAFRRSGALLQPIGRVIGTQDGLAMMDTVEARPGGQIAVQVTAEYSDGGEQYVPNQWRVYAWQGGRFRQVAGPTSFPADPPAAVLSVTSSALTFTRVAGGYVGDLTVTIGNTGRLDMVHAELGIVVPALAQPAGDGWTGCTAIPDDKTVAVRCPVADLMAGSTRELHFRFVATTVPVRSADPIGPENDGHYVTLNQLPPYVFLRDSSTMEAPFAVVGP
jgi:hypothetical protein